MNNYRRQDVLTKRILAAELASNRPHPRHIANGDEQKFRTTDKDGKNKPSYLASFTKGMPHDSKTGLLLEPEVFQNFVKGVDSGDPRDFQDTKLGPASKYESEDGSYSWRTEKANTSNGGCPVEVRAWESQGAGHTHDLEGPDASAVTMPPAPALGSAELSAEMAEVYAQALLRDVPFTEISSGEGAAAAKGKSKPKVSVKEIVSCLNDLSWFKDQDCCDLTDAEQGRKRKPLTSETAFRGITRGDNIGPYISQFMLAGNTGVNGHDKPEGGYIGYGALRIDQRVSYALEGDDHMLDWESWLDVQDGADLRGHEKYHTKGNTHRFITTPRDLATYVHHDALYESYLNACLLMLGI